MSKYTFLEGQAPHHFKKGFEQFIFNAENHRHAQSIGNWVTFSLVNEESKLVVAQVHFHISESIASSPAQAPFGSIDFSTELSPEHLSYFYSETEERLKSIGIKKIKIKNAALQFRAQQSELLSVLLLNFGYRVTNAEINSAIRIDLRDFDDKISHAEIKRLKRGRQANLDFKILPIARLDEIYSFIKACREEREMSLSMTLPQLQNTIQLCKENYLLFGLFNDGNLVAASIAIKVSSRILYDFYHAHAKSFDQLSPVVALIDGMYEYCLRNKFEWLDLGTSALDGHVNFSLLNFKTQLGGQRSMKLTFQKDLN